MAYKPKLLSLSEGGTGQALVSANNSILALDGSGNVIVTATLPSAVQGNITSTGNLGNQLNTTRCAFLCYMNTTTGAVTGDGTNATVVFDTKPFDQGSNVTLAGTTFTAPVTGKYLFNLSLTIGSIAASQTAFSIQIVTTARTYKLVVGNAVNMQAGTAQVGATTSIIAPMTAGDTCTVQATVTGGAKTCTIVGGVDSWFSGYLVC